MSEFETSAELSIHVPNREIKSVKRDIQDGIGSVNVSLDNGRATRPDGGASGAGLAGGTAAIEELGDQTQLLEDIHDELDGGAGGGGGASGGSGMFPVPIPASALITGTVAASSLIVGKIAVDELIDISQGGDGIDPVREWAKDWGEDNPWQSDKIETWFTDNPILDMGRELGD